MTGFVVWAVLLALAAALFVAWPLLRSRGDGAPATRLVAAAAVVLIGAGAGATYPRLSNWSWQQAAVATTSDTGSLAPLVQATEQHPNEEQPWLDLGRGYMRAEQWELARRSFEHANRLAGGRSAQALSGLAQTLLAADDPKQNEAALELFNRALGIDAHQPQALFYTAIAYMNSGQPQLARARFGAMLELDLPDAVRAGIQQQVAAIDSEIAGARSSAGTELHLQVTLAPELAGKVPAGAALFVFVRSPQGGPPLAVKRLMATFPQQVELSAADSPMPASRIKPGQSVQVVARISVAGTPMAGTGDLYGELSTVAGDHAQHDVLINRQNP